LKLETVYDKGKQKFVWKMVIGKNKRLIKTGKKGGKKKIINPFSRKIGTMWKPQHNSLLVKSVKLVLLEQPAQKSPLMVLKAVFSRFL